MEKKFEFPEVSVYKFKASDIITASPWDGEGEGGVVTPDPDEWENPQE